MQSAHVISWDQRIPDGGPLDPGSAQYRYRLLAEGDSWFTLGGLPTSNLLFSMFFKASTIIVNCALPGDTIRHVSEIASNRELSAALSRRFGWTWDAILLSAGGNDLIDRLWDIVLPPQARPAVRGPEDYCNEAAIRSLLRDVTDGYWRIARLRDSAQSPCPGAPIITHTYAHVTPRNSPASFIFVPAKGPWLYPVLVQYQVPMQHWDSVSDYLIGRLGDAIVSLAAPSPNAIPNFWVVDTRDALVRAAPGSVGFSNDWMNEIHPSFQGYAKLAARIGEQVNRLLPP